MRTRSSKFHRIILLIFGAVLICAAPLYSINLESVDIKGGLIWIGNQRTNPDGTVNAPSPLTTIVGVSLPIRFTSFFALEPELRYYGHPYGVEYGRPVPQEIEFAVWKWVLGFFLEPRAVFDFQIVETLTLSAYVSPTFLFRIPARDWGGADAGVIAAYQYGMGRFFYPEIGVMVDWELPFRTLSPEVASLNQGEFAEDEPYQGFEIHLVADFNVYFPLFHAWDDEDRPFYDQFMTSGVVGLRFILPPARPPK